MGRTSLRLAFVLAMLLSLACSAVAGRHLLQTSNTRYQTSSSPYSKTGGLTGTSTLDANVTATSQISSSFFRVMNISVTTPKFTNPGYYNSTGALVAEFPCTFQAESTSGSWNCTLVETATPTSPYQPVGTIKALVDSGLFTKSTGFYVSVKVDGVQVKGTITTSVTTF